MGVAVADPKSLYAAHVMRCLANELYGEMQDDACGRMRDINPIYLGVKGITDPVRRREALLRSIIELAEAML